MEYNNTINIRISWPPVSEGSYPENFFFGLWHPSKRTVLKWEHGEGGKWFGQVVKNHENSFMCDYSCTITAELAEDAFFYLETRNAGTDGEHDVYIAEVNATIQRRGEISGWGYCEFEEEYSSPFILEVQDFTTEGWVDVTLIWGEFFPPCFTGPLSTKVIP